MHRENERGRGGGARSRAVWGSGGRGGGDGRSDTVRKRGLWRLAVLGLATLALALPASASAAGGNGPGGGKGHAHFVAPNLMKKAKQDPGELVQVIVQADGGTYDALKHVGVLGPMRKLKRLDLVKGITVQIPAEWVSKLAEVPGLTITEDSPVQVTTTLGRGNGGPRGGGGPAGAKGTGGGPAGSQSTGGAAAGPQGAGGFSSSQLWPYESGNADLWPTTTAFAQPTIAIVDSGVDPTAGLGNRLLASVDLSTLSTNSQNGDGLGHGTLVSSIAAGSTGNYAGADPNANVVSLDVLDDQGQSNVSDVIAACDWILQHKDEYNIRVANFSLASTQQSNFFDDPLDQAVEDLWFHGITVVAAAGNYGNADGSPSGVLSAPGNDPFVITVGAADLMGTGDPSDDTVAPWSAWGRTHDGFMKPEMVAPGRYITGPVPVEATLYNEHSNRVKSQGYLNLSGSSLAAPVVSGTVAELLALHPDWTPDQVKGALMTSARPMPAVANPGQAGVGELDAVRTALAVNAPNPNAPLEQFISPDPKTGEADFDVDTWQATATANPNWDQVSWDQVSWDQVSWDQVSWDQVSWDQVSWDQVSWDQVSWDQVSWDQVSWDQVSWDQVSWDQNAALDDGPLGDDVTSADLRQIAASGPVLTILNGQ